MPPISSSDARDAAREAALESIVKNAPQRGRAALPYAHGGGGPQAGPAHSLGTPGLTPAHEMRRSNTSFPGAGRGGPPRNASFDAAAVAGGGGGGAPPMKRCASLSLKNDDIPRRSPSGGPPVLGVRIAPLGGRRPSGHSSPNGLPPKSPFKEAPASPLLSAGRGVVATPPPTPPNVKERVGSGRGMRMVAPPSSPPPPPQHHGKTRAAPPPSPIQDLPRHVSSRASPAHLQQLRPVVPSSPATSGTSRSPSQHPPSPQQPPSPATRQEEAPVMVPPPSPPGHQFDRSSTQSTRGRNAAAIAMSSLDMVEEVLSQSVATNERTMKGLNCSKGSAALSDPDMAAATSAAPTPPPPPPPQAAVVEAEPAQEVEEAEHETGTATAAGPETVTVSHCSASDDGRSGGRGKTPAVETEEEGTQTDARRGGGGGGGGGLRRRASVQPDGGSDALSDSLARNLMTTVPMQDNVHSLFTTSSAASDQRLPATAALPATALPKEAKRIQLLPRAVTSSSPPSPQSGVAAPAATAAATTSAASVSPPPSRSSSGSPQVVPYTALAGRHLPPPSSASPENGVGDAVAVAAGDAAATQFLHSHATGPLDVIPQLSRGSSASPAAAAGSGVASGGGANGGVHALTQDRLWEDMIERAAAAAGVPQHEARRVLVSPASGAGEEEVRAFCEEGLGYGKLDATRLRVMWRRRAAAAASSSSAGGGGDAASAANQPPPRPQLALDGLWGEVHAALRGLDLREADLFAPLGAGGAAGGGEPDEGALADYFSFCREALNVSNMQALRLLTSWRSGAASAPAPEPPAAASDAPTPAPAVAAAAAAGSVSRGGGSGGGVDPTDSQHHSPIVSPNRTRGSRGVPPPATAHPLVDAAATPPSPPLPPRCSPCLSAVAPSSGAWATVVELLQGTAYVMDPFVAVSLHGIFAIEPLPGDIASFREECARVRARAAAATSADAGLWHPQGRLLYFNPPRGGGGGGGGGGGSADGHYTSALPLTHAQLVEEADQRGYLPFTTGSPELGCGRCVRKTTRSVLLCEVVLGRLDAPVVKEGDPSGRTLAAGAEADALGVDYVYTRGGEEQVLLPPNDAARSPSPAPPGPRQMVGRQFLVREPRLVLPRYRVDVVVELHEPTPVRQHSPLRVRRSPTLPPQPAPAAAVAVTRAGSGGGSRSRSRSPTRSRSPPRAVYHQAAQRATRSPSPPPSLPPATAALASMSPGGSSLRAPSPTRDAVEAAGSLIHLPLQRAVRSLYEGYDAVERGVSERLSAEKAAVAALRDRTLETTQAALRAKRHIKERIEAVEKLLESKKKELLGKVDEAEHSRKEELAQAAAAKKKRSDELAALLDTLVEVKREKAAAAASPAGGASVTHAVQAVQQLSVFREAAESDKAGAGGGAAMNTTFLTVSSSNHSLVGGDSGAARHASAAAFQPDYTLDLSGVTRSIEELQVSAPGGLLREQQQQPGSFLSQNPQQQQQQPFLGQFESMLSGLSSSADTTPKALALMPPNPTQPQPLTVGRSASLSAPQSALSLVPAMSRSVSGGGGGDGGNASVNFKWVSSPLESPSTLASVAQSSTGAAGRKAWTAVMGDMASVLARAGASVFANAGAGLAIGKWSDALTVDASRLSGDRELFLSRKSNITTEWVVELRLEAGTAVELGVFVVGHTAAAEEEDRLVTLPQTLRYPAVVLARLTVRGGSRPPSLSLYHVHEGTGTEERLLTRSLSPFDLSFPFYVATVLRGPGEVVMVNPPVKRAD